MTAPRRWDLGLAVTVFALRIPLLSTQSYGLDPDAWRIALSGAALVRDGVYIPSRPPAYPLVEAVSAVVWAFNGGPLLFGVFTALVSVLGAVAFAQLLRTLGSTPARAGSAAFAAFSVPVVLTASVTSIDYVWSLTPALLAYRASARGNALRSGGWLAAAALARPTALFLGIGVAALLRWYRRDDWFGQSLKAGLIASLALLVFVPILAHASAFGPVFYDGGPTLRTFIRLASIGTWGLLGCLGIAIGSGVAVFRSRSGRSREAALTLGATCIPVAILFARLPLEAGYLIPLVPPMVGALALTLRPTAWRTVVTLLVLSPWLAGLEATHAVPPSAHDLTVIGPATLTAEGTALLDREWRRLGVMQADSVLAHRTRDDGSDVGQLLASADGRALLTTGQHATVCLLYAEPPRRNWSVDRWVLDATGCPDGPLVRPEERIPR